MHEVFEHTADVGLRIRAPGLPQLFSEAAEGLFGLIVSNLEDVEPREKISLSISARASEYDYLLFDWLNELLYMFDTRHWVAAKFEVRLNGCDLEASVSGESLDTARHRIGNEVKAITYHGLKVERQDDGWLAEVIVDI